MGKKSRRKPKQALSAQRLQRIIEKYEPQLCLIREQMRNWQVPRPLPDLKRIWDEVGPTAEPPLVDDEPLTETEQTVYDLIVSDGPISGKEICSRLPLVQDSTLRRHIIPRLKDHKGVKNRRGAGYYVG